MLRLARLPSGKPEIFPSLQGEGASVGTPSTFVRLALCNLACSWCDTRYTWDWANFERSVETMAVAPDDVVRQVQSLGLENVVITGGEPLLQQRALIEMAEELRRRGHRLEVETNGTLKPAQRLARQVSQWNVSPKLNNSANSHDRSLIPGPLHWFAASRRAWFKFVIDALADIGEVEDLLVQFDVSAERVILMPLGTTRQELEERSAWLAEASLQRGYRFSTRLHVLIWGDERGR